MTTANSKSNEGKPTVVLVHGAFAESSSWNGVLREMSARGYPVVAAANPLRGAKSDAAYIASILKGIEGPIVLAGHSYGGTVITNAVNGNKNVKALVFVAAFAPEAGETSFELTSRFPGATLEPTLATPVALPDGDSDLYIQQDKFPAQFAADVPLADAKLMAETQRPIKAAAGQRSLRTSCMEVHSFLVHLRRPRSEYSAGSAVVHGRTCQRQGGRGRERRVTCGDGFASRRGRRGH